MTERATDKDVENLRRIVEKDPGDFDDFLDVLDWHLNRVADGENPEDHMEAELAALLPDLELLDEFGGEGDGSTYWKVFRYRDRLFQLTGTYSSWNGVDFYGSKLVEVYGEQVMTTIYHPVKKS